MKNHEESCSTHGNPLPARASLQAASEGPLVLTLKIGSGKAPEETGAPAE